MAKKRIMIVDDEPHLLELVKAILEAEGFSVDTAPDGRTALHRIRIKKPDLLILDMMMPGMSGREVCEEVRKESALADLKVIMLTVARFSEVGRKMLGDLKVSDYITKPFDNRDLVARVRRII